MNIEYCLRCNLPIRRDRGCICTFPNLRVYSSTEIEYILPSTPEFPMRWISTFIEKGEVYRFRGGFFEPVIKGEIGCMSMNIDDNYYEILEDIDNEFQIKHRFEYSGFLDLILQSEVNKSIKLIQNQLDITDRNHAKYLLDRYLKRCKSIIYNIRKINKVSDIYQPIKDNIDVLYAYVQNEFDAFAVDLTTRSNVTQETDQVVNSPNLTDTLKGLFLNSTDDQIKNLIKNMSGEANTQPFIYDDLIYIGRKKTLWIALAKIWRENSYYYKTVSKTIVNNCKYGKFKAGEKSKFNVKEVENGLYNNNPEKKVR